MGAVNNLDKAALIEKLAAVVIAVCGAVAAVLGVRKLRQVAVEPVAEPVSPAPPVKRRVLLLDDEKPLLEALRYSLNGDFEIRSYSDPYDAIEDVLDGYRNGKRFDVAIIDYRLGVIDGPEVVKVMRALEHAVRRRSTKIAFLSGIGQMLNKNDFEVDAIWRKPQDCVRLKELIEDLLADQDY